MASADTGDPGSGNLEGDYAGQPDTTSAEAALRARLSRKRTKTGCLTCRKRRIKCDETRPICRNCVKSKRLCDGYNQRVVFKQPNFDFRSGPNGSHITFSAGPGPSHPGPWPPEQAPGDPSAVFHHYGMEQPYQPLQQMQHFPMEQAYHGQPQPPPQVYPHQSGHAIPMQQVSLDHLQQQQQQQPPPPPQIYQFGSSVSPMQGQPNHQLYANGEPQTWAFRSPVEQGQHYTQPLPVVSQQSPAHPGLPTPAEMQQENQWTSVSPVTDQSRTQISPTSSRGSRTHIVPYTTAIEDPSTIAWSTNGYVPRPELSQPIDYRPHLQPTSSSSQYEAQPAFTPMGFTLPVYDGAEPQRDLFDIPPNFLQNAAVETVDDDYYDIQSDEEEDTSAVAPRYQIPYRSFSQIVAANNIVVHDPRRRRYDTFIHPGILAHYKPDEVANPLGNEATARLFLHFIAVTGPSLSIYERQVRNTSMLFTEGKIPFSQQGLWTYTMPLAALRNTGLLHAMLALASLHVAKLTNASTTPSYLHYAWALKRVHSSVGDEKKRFRLTTMAASMLLGFYEIMTAEHTKWNAHLAGSKQLFLDTDFCTMTKQFTQMKRDRAKRAPRKRRLSAEAQAQDNVLDQVHDVEEKVVSELSGREVKYDSHGQILTPSKTIPQALDVGKFEILRDLFWWYLKQDAYQSIVSGNPLMLPYDHWTDCPPRAPLGKSDAVYGSFDNLILLLGRIANFAALDRKRKLRVMEANGGQWKPPSGMKMPRPPQPPPQAAPPTPQTTTSTVPPNGSFMPVPMPPGGPPAGPPMFFGMAPAPKNQPQMPASYRNGIPTPEATSPQDPTDLHQATQNAQEEYGRIRAALHTFASKLGDAFKPLTADHQPPLETPFGPALFYRSYDIGCLWAVYYMAMIVAIRSAPHMHPAAHVAAGFAAEETRFFANEIGRIAAGIVPGPADLPLNPTLGAALSESCMPSFFAAIQYKDPAQRYHTVTRLKSIAQRTGWGSTELIANGCETAWVKAAEAGRGPPYTRIARTTRSSDPRVNGSWETLDPNASPDVEDLQDRRLVPTSSNARLTWAIGIMGTEDDERTA